MNAHYIIAGGGIGGTVLAHLLARAGKKVLVIEKSVHPPRFVRPEGLWPDTAALLKTILPQKEVAQAWVPLQGVRVFEGERQLLNETHENFVHAGAELAMTDPNQTREQLLQLGTFELRRGVEVTGVLKDGARVVGVKTHDLVSGEIEELTAEWTIGDDGVHSKIREAAGIPLKTENFPVEFMAFGFEWPKTLPYGVAHIWLNQDRTHTGMVGMFAAPMPHGRGAGLIPTHAHAFDALTNKEEAWTDFLLQNPRLHDVAWHVKFPRELARIQRPWGHAEKYGTQGAILIGDAVHPVSPAGGQGANMSVADAAALAEVFLSGHAEIVEEYERRRRPANERSIAITRRGAQVLHMPAFLVNAALPYFMRWINSHPDLFERGVKAASVAFQE